MFEVRFVTKDKDLGDALRALKAIALEPPVVIPVDDSVPDVVSVGQTNGFHAPKVKKAKRVPKFKRNKSEKTSDRIINELIANKPEIKIISREEIVKTLVAHGYARGSDAYVYSKLMKAGVFTASPHKGIYQIHREKVPTYG